jgi:hypothetical protein
MRILGMPYSSSDTGHSNTAQAVHVLTPFIGRPYHYLFTAGELWCWFAVRDWVIATKMSELDVDDAEP